MGFNPTEVTLFGVVAYDPATSTHSLVGVQTKEVVVLCDETPSAPAIWSVTPGPDVGMPGGLPLDLFKVAWNDAAGDSVGSVALNWQAMDAAPFLSGGSITLWVAVPDTTGDGGALPAETHALTVHLRALPGLELLHVPDNSVSPAVEHTALLGAGGAPTDLVASAPPASTAFGPIPAWTEIHWAAPGVTATTPGTSTTITGGPASFNLTLSTASPASPDPVGATFDDRASYDLPGAAVVEVQTNALQPAIVVDSTAPVISVANLDLEVGVSPGASETIHCQVEVDDGLHYFSLKDVTIAVTWTERGTSTTANASWKYNNGSSAMVLSGATPAGTSVTMPEPVVTDAERPPIDPAGWGGEYAEAAHSARRATWGDGTPGGNIQIHLDDGRFEGVEIAITAVDHAGNSHTTSRSVLVSVPVDLVLSLDYSGSMSSPPDGGGPAGTGVESKWDAARAAANRLHAVFHAIAPAIGGASGLVSKIGYVRFWWLGNDATGADQTSAVVALTDVSAGPAPGTLVADTDPPWLQYTPIAAGVQAAVAELSGGANLGWRRRVVVAMTDGHQNRGMDIADIRATSNADPNFIPNLDDDPQNGIIVHSCAFGEDAGVDADEMDWLATGSDGGKGFGGQFHTTATAAGTDAAKALTDRFLNILVDAVPSINRLPSTDAFGGTIPVGVGDDKVVFLITTDDAATLVGPSGATSTGFAAGVRWWVIDNPAVGDYSVSVPTLAAAGQVDLHAVVDLQLRADFSVQGAGTVGSTLTLRACVRDAGRPVPGAEIYATVTRPEGSDGEAVTRYGALIAQRDPRRAVRVPGMRVGVDAFSRRLQLVRAARYHFSGSVRRFAAPTRRVRLLEVAGEPGCYEASFNDTGREGSYGFEFRADGELLEGGRFARSFGVSRYLSAVVDAAATRIDWTLLGRRGRLWRWRATVRPTTSTGLPIGGGKRFGLTRGDRSEPVEMSDRLDGTYTAEVETPEPAPPPVAITNGSHTTPLEPGAAVTPTVCPRRVRVVLTHVEVGDVREGLCDETGELSFDVIVAPDRARSRAVRSRLPRKGTFKFEAGARMEVDTEVFDGYVDEGSTLLVVVGGREHDWDGADKLCTYRRVFSGSVGSWHGEHGPRDESPDPEWLEEWKLWYRIEVI